MEWDNVRSEHTKSHGDVEFWRPGVIPSFQTREEISCHAIMLDELYIMFTYLFVYLLVYADMHVYFWGNEEASASAHIRSFWSVLEGSGFKCV